MKAQKWIKVEQGMQTEEWPKVEQGMKVEQEIKLNGLRKLTVNEWLRVNGNLNCEWNLEKEKMFNIECKLNS